MASHAKTWVLAQHGRVGIRRSRNTMSRSPHSDKRTLTNEMAAWESDRNSKHAKVDWHFTNNDARIKLKRLYSQFECLGH
jgi:hypothetical protein